MPQRLLTAYVDVPPTPPKLQRLTVINEPATPLLTRNENVTHASGKPQPMKKQKTNPGVRIVSRKVYDPINGSTCHQCRQKTMVDAIRCTHLKNDKRCSLIMCQRCLQIRYGEQIESIIAAGRIADSKQHDPTTEYTWSCPKCRGICNCSICRKSKNLPPTGILAYLSKKAGVSSANELLEQPGMLEEVIKTHGDSTASQAGNGLAKRKLSREQQSNAPSALVPKPIFVPIPGTETLTVSDLMPRIFLREFIYRFGMVLKISKKHVKTMDDMLWPWNEEIATIFARKLLNAISTTVMADVKHHSYHVSRNGTKRQTPDELWDAAEVTVKSHDYIVRDNSTEHKQLSILIGLCDIALHSLTLREEIDKANEAMVITRRDAVASIRESQEAWNKRKAVLQSERMTIALKDQVEEWKDRFNLAQAQFNDDIRRQEVRRHIDIRKLSTRGECCIGSDILGNKYYQFSDVGGGNGDGNKWGQWIVLDIMLDKAEDKDSSVHEARLYYFDDHEQVEHLSKWIRQEASMQGPSSLLSVSNLLSALEQFHQWLTILKLDREKRQDMLFDHTTEVMSDYASSDEESSEDNGYVNNGSEAD